MHPPRSGDPSDLSRGPGVWQTPGRQKAGHLEGVTRAELLSLHLVCVPEWLSLNLNQSKHRTSIQAEPIPNAILLRINLLKPTLGNKTLSPKEGMPLSRKMPIITFGNFH